MREVGYLAMMFLVALVLAIWFVLLRQTTTPWEIVR